MLEPIDRARSASTGWWAPISIVGMVLSLIGCTDAPVGRSNAGVEPCGGPDIDLWYGEELWPDSLGHPQDQVNVLGNVSDGDGVASLRYALGSEPFREAPMGRDGLRLQDHGDFNIEIDRARLDNGPNSLLLEVENSLGEVCERAVTIHHDDSARWPLPYSARFNTVADRSEIEQVATPVDGLWEVTSTGLRTERTGYDRLLAVGDRTWEPGYEARARVTLHRFGSWGGVGLGVGWQGHTGPEDPAVDWPIGGLGWVRNKTDDPSLEIAIYGIGTRVSTPLRLFEGETYVFAIQSEPDGPDHMYVRVKVWNETDAEPPDWMAIDRVPRRRGSVLLLAHAADVTWHGIDVRRPTDPPLDAGVPSVDSGAAGPDAGMPSIDAGVPTNDATTPTEDAGMPGDSGAPGLDAGTQPDGGARSTGGLLALYELDEGSGTVIHDTSGHGPPTDLTIADPGNVTWLRGGLSVDRAARITSDGGEGEIASAIASSNEVSVETWLRSADLEQDGPARIVTLSGSPYARNVTLGQGLWGSRAADRFDVRLRTTATGDNGQPSLTTPPGSLTGELTHVVYTRDSAGTAHIYVNGSQWTSGSQGGQLSSWDPTHTLALANEVGGGRPWLGELHFVAVFDRALSAGEVEGHFQAGPDGSGSGANPPPVGRADAGQADAGRADAGSPPGDAAMSGPRVFADLLALYEMDEGTGTVVRDTSGAAAPVDLRIEDPSNVTWEPDGLSVHDATRIRSDGPASELARAVAASNELTVEAWITPANLTQDGPARIVSLSGSPYARNITVGQGLWGGLPADRIDVRLRTSTTSNNGQPSLTTGAGTLPPAMTHVVYTRDRTGRARIYLDGVEYASGLVEGTLSAWDPDQPLVLANEVGGNRPWLGTLHLVALYDRALSATEVDRNFAAGPN